MPTNSIQAPTPKLYPAEIKTILERGNAGDLSVLPELKRVFDANPELTVHLGDLVKHAEQSLLALAAGPSLTAKEAIARQVDELRSRLTDAASSELEKLLIERVVISWIEVYHGDIELAHRLLKNTVAPDTQAAERRLGRAHQRYLSAVKALATVQKLLKPTLTPLEIATGIQRKRVAGTPQRQMSLSAGGARNS